MRGEEQDKTKVHATAKRLNGRHQHPGFVKNVGFDGGSGQVVLGDHMLFQDGRIVHDNHRNLVRGDIHREGDGRAE
jgi:hypothetical protein